MSSKIKCTACTHMSHLGEECGELDGAGDFCDCDMTFIEYNMNHYQRDALETAVYPDQGKLGGLIYAVLGLTGEAGELANKLKKHLRSGTPVDNAVLLDEAGDVQWYLAAVARELNSTLNEMAKMNIKKLNERKITNTIKEHK